MDPLALLLITAPWTHQEVLRTWPEPWGEAFGTGSIAWMSDLDGDGSGELLYSDALAVVDGLQQAGRVVILSGRTGALIREHEGSQANAYYGASLVLAPDMDEDGIEDYLVSHFVALGGEIRSGRDGHLVAAIHRFAFADAVQDLDGDRVADLLTSEFFFRSTGTVRTRSGASWEQIYSVDSPPGSTHFGWVVRGMSDIDGDGLGDYVVGAPGGLNSDTVCVPGEIYVLSGFDGEVWYKVEGEGLNSFFGGEIETVRDITGDTITDLVVAADFCCCEVGCTFGCLSRPGRVYFFDGATGLRLGTFEAPLGTAGLGEALIAVGDLNGDGFEDVIATFDTQGNIRNLVAIDGRSRKALYKIYDPYLGGCIYGGFAQTGAPAGDTNGDDFPDFLVSSLCSTSRPRSRVDLFSGAPAGVRTLGGGCGSAPRIGLSGVPSIGATLPLHVSRVEPALGAVLVVGRALSGISVPRASGPGSCALALVPQRVFPTITKAIRPGEGAATIELKLPRDPAWIGSTFLAQWLVRESDGSRGASRVLEIEIQPIDPARGH